ncbi:MAG TPA: oligopeptide/dipeptide ABC transporter ATP-binding protein [Actinocrinis sp.]|uniref:ABC transporter ATP-binding protein n=1 Tax=Actinocrinis sp. TaxID=1920516 RepID=UPI002DDCE74E|nr:oligopeptide/dipeptide ABC transporter ATP-binding protein [Actinocrinis sp.]HEV3168932.1 oligopeptide/dipeptide ABC transporter ATP-binding protein [Actinocrinis sp.]
MTAAAPALVAPETGRHPILSVRDLVKEFPITSPGIIRRRVGTVHAVSGISFDLFPGETLGLVGESGCGKTTTSRAVLHLQPATSGQVFFEGRDVTKMSKNDLRRMRRNMQIVFQDPYASLNPRITVNEIIAEPLKIHGMWDDSGPKKVADLMRTVGLNPEHGNRFPHEFSGGQRQRIGIARALALRPKVLVLDEPVSALDVSIQAGVINLLEDLQDELGLAYLFVAHDLSVVRHIADRVAVMYLGKIVEVAPTTELFERPQHPYTQALISAIPIPDPRKERERERIILQGDVPSPANPPSGCRFRTRCPKFLTLSEVDSQKCVNEEPPLVNRGQGPQHVAACHYAEVLSVI